MTASTTNTPASNDFVPVPRVPTDAMLDAMHDRIRILVDPEARTADIQNDRELWSALLAAAPASPEPASNEAPSDMVRAIACVFTSMPERMANTNVSLDGQNLGTLWQLATDIASAVASASNEAPGRGGVENPSAFPYAVPTEFYAAETGMTMRDWFAGRAVSGVLSNSENVAAGAEPTNCALSLRPEEYAAWLARVSYLVADAMLAARKGAAA